MSEVQKYLYIKADTNDGDYVAELTKIDEKTANVIIPVVAAIKKCKQSYNFLYGDMHSHGEKTAEELYSGIMGYEEFRDRCPYGEYGIHTIEEVRILHVVKEEKLI